MATQRTCERSCHRMMANKILKQKALEMRHRKMSYSMIKDKLGDSKSTLSWWLKDYPLSKERINELRGNNVQRIERYRNTMAEKRLAKEEIAFKKVSFDIGKMTKRELKCIIKKEVLRTKIKFLSEILTTD